MGKVVFDRKGESGNIFWILAHAQQVLRWEGRLNDSIQMAVRVRNSHSYDEALEIVAEYVELEEVRHDDD